MARIEQISCPHIDRYVWQMALPPTAHSSSGVSEFFPKAFTVHLIRSALSVFQRWAPKGNA